MSQDLTRQRNCAAVTPSRAGKHAAALLLFLVALLGVAAAPAGAATAAEREDNRQQLCELWDVPTDNPEVEITSDLKVSGELIQRIGTSCNDPKAQIRILNAKVEETATGVNGTAAAQVLAAVTRAAESGELGEGSELFKGAVISRFWIGFDLATGFYAAGEVRLDWSGGTTSYFAFRGTIRGLDAFDFKLNSPPSGTVLPNIGGKPLNFTGDLQLRGKRYNLDITAAAPAITIGEGANKLSITNATVKAKLNDAPDGTQRFAADVTGDIAYGDNIKVKGSVALEFDDSGAIKLTGAGAVDVTIPAKGSSPAGSVKGDATITYSTGGNLLVTFAGDVRFGEVLVAGAKGTLDPLSVNFTGDATVDYKDVQFKGGVEGVVFIGYDLAGRTITNRAGDQVPAKNSDWLIKSATANVTAKGLVLAGVAQIGQVGDEQWLKGNGSVDLTFQAPGIPETDVDGSASVDWLKGSSPKVDFAGTVKSGSTVVANAKGAVDGQKIDFAGDVTLQNPDLKITGAVDGSVFYGSDLAGATIKNRAGQEVPASKGDFLLRTVKGSFDAKGFTVGGAATIGRVGGDRWAKGSGSVNGTYATTKITGSADIDWVAPNVPSVTFKGRFVSGSAAMADAEGTVDGNKLTVKGSARLLRSGFSVTGAAEAVMYYGSDLAGEKITDRFGDEVQAERGDFLIKSASAQIEAQNFTVKGAAQVGRVGGATFAKGGGDVDLTFGSTNVKGSVTADFLLGSPIRVGFAGTVTSGTTIIAGASGTFDGTKIAVKGNASFTDPKLSLAGAVEGVVYYGDDLAGETVANRAGTQVPAKKGDFLVKSASGEVAIKGLKLTGDIALSSVGTERWATGGGTVDLTYGATTIKGSAKLAWAQGEAPVVSFEGSVATGDTFVGNAKGTIDAGKVTFAGDLKLTNPALSATGSVTEGVVYYGTELTGQKITDRSGAQVQAKQGDLYLKTAATADLNTKGFKLTGAAQAGSTGGERWVKGGGTVDFTTGGTTIKGAATAEWIVGKSPSVAFEGSVTQGDVKIVSAKGTIDDKKLTIEGDAALVVSGISVKGAASATVFFGSDLTGETVTNAAGDKVPATKGDIVVDSAKAEIVAKGFTLVGQAQIGFVGGKLFAEGSGGVDLTYGSTNVKGLATATWAMGSQPTVAFAGTLTQGTTAVANVLGQFDGKKLLLKGDATLTDPRLTLTGSVEGALYYGDDLAGETVQNRAGVDVPAKKGDYVVSDASGKVAIKNLDLAGKLTLASVGGEKWATAGGTVDFTYGQTNVKGSATLNWAPGTEPSVAFEGSLKSGDVEVASAKGTLDGNKITFTGKASVKNSLVTLDGDASGAVYYGPKLDGEKITNHAGTEVTPVKGDFVLNAGAAAKLESRGVSFTGKATVSSVAGEKWVAGGGAVDVTYGTINVKGGATLDWIFGKQPVLTFEGAVKSADVEVASAKGTITDKTIDFSGTAGISNAQLGLAGAVEGKLFYAADQTGQKVKNRAGVEVDAKRGDLVLKSASAKIDAKGFTLTGAVEVGLLSTEKWVKGGGKVDATYGSTKITGSADVDWLIGSAPSVTFAGSLTNGSTVVANASGAVDGKKIAIKGDVALTDPKYSLRGAAEGTLFFGTDLTGERVKNRAGQDVAAKKGDFVLKSASGEVVVNGLTLKGAASFSSVGSEKWATGTGAVDVTYNGITLKGTATASWVVGETPTVSFEGSVSSGDTEVANAKGTLDGKKITIEAGAKAQVKVRSAQLTLAGDAKGTFYYGADQTGETVTNKAGDDVAAKKGDWLIESASATITTSGFSLVGGAQIGSVDGERWVSGGGAVDLTVNGTTLRGSAVVDWVIGKSPAIAFDGSVAQGDVTIASASGTLDDKKLTLKGDATLSVAGFGIKGAVSGTVFFGSDLSGLTVTNAAGDQVPATKGDILVESASAEVSANGFDLKGKATIGFVGGKLWAQGGGDVDLTYGATNIKGSATAKWAAGSKPTVGFAGTLKNGTTVVAGASGTFDGSTLGLRGDVALTDPRFSLKGAAEGTLYIGDLAGVKVKNRVGTEVQATKGDFVLTSASGEVLVNSLTLKGQASFSSIGTEKWAKGGGSVDLTYQGINLRGNASAEWVVGQAPSVSFDGTIKAGETEVANAKGLIDGKKIVLAAGAQGQATIVGTELSLKGAASGAFYYAADQTGEKVKNKAGTEVQAKQGDFVLDSASATVTVKGLTLVGKASAGSVGGQKWVTGGGSVDITAGGTNVKGSATADWIVGEQPKVTFEGAVSQNGVTVAGVKGTLDSTKLTFQGEAALSVANLGIKGAVSGAVYLGSDLSGQKIKNAAGAEVTPARGDLYLDSASAEITAKGFTLTGEAQVGFVGGKLWANGGGSVDLTYGATKLAGKANASWAQGGTPSVSFSGTLTNGTTVVANAAGVFDGKKIAVKGDATLTDPRFTLKGAVDGVLFYGTDLSGEVLKNRAGVDVQPSKGDFAITSASGEVLVKNLTLKGQVAFTSLGTEKWATGGGSVDLTAGGFNLTGSATVDYVVGGTPTVKFKGAFKSGDTEIANASGELDGKKIALSGAATVKTNDLSVAGAASGVVYYAADQSGETVKNKAGTAVPATRGDFLITSASAKVDYKSFSLSGQAQVGSVGTEKWVTGGGSVDLTYGTVNVKGSATVDWTIGKTPSLTFEGALKNSDVEIANAKGSIDDKKITFSGGAQVSTPNLSVSGSVTGGVLYYGSSLTGETITNKAGASVQASKGDLRIESASADVTAKGLALKAKVTVGIVGSQRWVSGGGSVDGTYGATNLKGSADFDWLIGQIPSVAFQGTLTNGTAIVANAAGVLDGKKIAIKGDAKATLPNLTVAGAVDGVFFYGKDLAGETVENRAGQQVQPLTGDYLLRNASGTAEAKGLALAGGISIGNVRGDWWATAGGSIDISFGQPVTRITGSASIKSDGNVAFEGQITNGPTVAKVSGTADGQKIVFTGDLSNPMLSGKASGVVYYGSALGGATIVNRAGQTVAANRGDFKIDVTDGSLVLKQLTVSGANASLVKAGTDIWIKGGGVIKIANTPITFSGEADNTGYVNLKGSGSVDFDGTTVAFSGSATIKDGRLVITGGGTLTNGLFSASVQGTIEKPNMAVSQYVLTGTANFKFANFSVANATVRLTFGEGLTTAFSIKSCFVMFICPNATYKLYFSGGRVARAELNAPVAWAAQFLAIGALALPGAQIDTKITGFI